MSRRSLMLCLGVLLCAAGCSPAAPTGMGSGGPTGTSPTGIPITPIKKDKYTLAVIPKGTTHVFWKSVHAGAEKAAAELGNVEIMWKGPQKEDDKDGQITVVQNFITKKVDGICLAPLDSQALVPFVVEAKQAGIPTVIFDSGLDDESNIVSYVATDNFHGGKLAAQQLGKEMAGKGSVILLRYNPGSESTAQREEGFLETLKAEFPEIKVLSEDQYSGTTPESSLAKCEQLFGKFQKDVTGCFAVCEPNGRGMLGALENLQLDKKVKFVGFDPSEELVQAMRDGKMHGIVLQDPVTMGYKSVMAMMQHLEGKPVEKRIPTGEYLATPENLDTPEMKKLLDPEKFGE